MTDDEAPGNGTSDHLRWAGRIIRWAVLAAVVLAGIGAVKIGVWANHWYVAEHFFYPDVDPAHPEGGPYRDIAKLLRSGNEALVDGVVRLGEAAVLVIVAVVLHRRRRSTSAAPSRGPLTVGDEAQSVPSTGGIIDA
jgi:hypothetical protein